MAFRLTVKLSIATIEIHKKWETIFKVPRQNNYWPRFAYSVKLSFENENKIKSSSHEQNLGNFTTDRLSLKESKNDPKRKVWYTRTNGE